MGGYLLYKYLIVISLMDVGYKNKLGFCLYSVRILRNWPSRKCVGKENDWKR